MINHIKRQVSKKVRQLIREERESAKRVREVIHFPAYPKTGGTWLKLMLNSFFLRFYELGDANLSVELQSVQLLNQYLPKLNWTHEDSYIITESGNLNKSLTSVFDDRPPTTDHGKCLLLIRDPRDVVVSYFHQVTKRTSSPLSLESIEDFVLDPTLGIDRVLAYYRRYQRYSHTYRHFKLIRYESLLTNTERELDGVLRFIGIPDPPECLIREIVDQARPEQMRKLEVSGRIEGMNSFSKSDVDALKVRKAKIGTYKEELSAEVICRVNERIAEYKDPFGYLNAQ
ncbi:Sulfotransferase domain protein [Novipirellula galeiformis]|uniref:Sulfotransferase domain protein n=1 Tax=Novipirellula galeiformis TaxID=2528004 RepID=A0A5C6CCM4_9BACT|nr:sulfotransferase domain-containing protein [Novipirellula galeiformis]TWU21221.1 Sulfotransferase domain protein [Novipirellula galeiformis]